MSLEAMKQALEAAYLAGFKASAEGYNAEWPFGDCDEDPEKNVTWVKERENYVSQAIATEESSATQEPVAYDKTELNSFVQDLYDKKMLEGKHGHYETLFYCVHQAIKRIYTHPQPKADQEPKREPLTSKQINRLIKDAGYDDGHGQSEKISDFLNGIAFAEAAHGIKGEE